jgi:peptide chain release factor 2
MQSEIQSKFNEIDNMLNILKKHMKWDTSINRIRELNDLIENPDFWNDATKAQLVMREKTHLEKTIESLNKIENEKNNLFELIDLAEEENDISFLNETISSIDSLALKCEKLQIESLLSG